jgi:hypothetical protein
LPAKGSPPLPLRDVNVLGPGLKLRYEPVKISGDLKNTARISVIIVPASDSDTKHFKVLTAQPVKNPSEWPISEAASAIGITFGTYGIDTKKVSSFVEKHPEVIDKLANYAEESTRVEALVKTLAQYEKSPESGKSLQSVLQGFSSQYGVQLPSFDNKTASSQQVLNLLKAIAPAVTVQDPLPSRSDVAVKAGGLAESVAVGYFGAPVALTVSGAALFQSLHSTLFPPTNFRSAFAQPEDSGAINLCPAKDDKETRTHIDYIWMSRVPNEKAPTLSLAPGAHIALGMEQTIVLSADAVAQKGSLLRARNWRLISGANTISVPVKITNGSSSNTISLDLSKAHMVPGKYQLAADWDWTPFKVSGELEVHALGNIANVSLTADSRDALITGTGSVQIELKGTDFEFVDSVSLVSAKILAKSAPLPFTLPMGKQRGVQGEMHVEVDTTGLAPGEYLLAIRQINGAIADVPVTIHPPNPELTQTPVRVNMGEPQQRVILHGKYLDRIEKITSMAASWMLAAVPEGTVDTTERVATIKLSPTARKGDQVEAEILISGLEKPLRVDAIVKVAGPRPQITTATKSFPTASRVELRDGEIPSGTAVSFALQGRGIDSRPKVDLACSSEVATRHQVSLLPGDKTDSAELDVTGEGSLFLSLDPAVIGDSGCGLTVTVSEPETGSSEPFALGRVIRLPQISTFTVTDEKLGESTYAATLTGRDLQLVEKTGWETTSGELVQGIPTPIPGSPREQTLSIAITWPPPSPKAPLYIWLRGENRARKTNARY